MKDSIARTEIEYLAKDFKSLKEQIWKINSRIEGLAKSLGLKEDEFPHFEKVKPTDKPNE